MRKILLLLLVLVLGCKSSSTSNNVVDNTTSDPTIGTIYIVDTPNNILKPGDILLKDKTTGGLTKLTSLDVNIGSADTQIPSKEISKENSFSGLLNFLGLKNFPLTVKPSTLRNSNVKVTLSSSDVELKYLKDGLLSLTKKVKAANKEINESRDDLNIRLGKEDVILLTDLYYSKDVKYSINAGKEKIDSLNLGFEKIADADIRVFKEDSTIIDLTIKRKNPLGFAYKLRKLNVRKGYNGYKFYLSKN